jgi:hypothetical protein
MMAKWCIRCGVAHVQSLATGVDEDGEPACGAHQVKPGRYVEGSNGSSGSETSQKRETKMSGEKKLCPVKKLRTKVAKVAAVASVASIAVDIDLTALRARLAADLEAVDRTLALLAHQNS